MKKKNGLCLLLCLALLVQCLSFGVLATQAETPTESQPTESQPTETAPPTEAPTQAPTEIPVETVVVDDAVIPDVSFGEAEVAFGCRTIDACAALGGSEKLLSTAKGVFVYETNSDTVLYSYNPDQHLAPGGLVQFVTAMLVIENCRLDDVITVSTRYINELPLGVRHQNLRNGEEITVRDLLYCMLLASANDAAVVLAQHVAGTPERFVSMMNQWVKDHGCTDTVLTTVSGLDDEAQYSTPRDMARILDAAMENESFRQIAGTGAYTVGATNKSDPRELQSANYFLEGASVSKFYDERVTAGKASYTSSKAGATIGFAAETEELSLICVIIGATRKFIPDSFSVSRYGNFEEAEALLSHCFGKFRVARLLYKGQPMRQIAVEGGANDVAAINSSSVDIVLPTTAGLADLTMRYDVVGGSVKAPVKAGQEVATLQLWYGSVCVGETTLHAAVDVAAQETPGFTIQDGATRSDADMAQLLMFLSVALAVILVPLGAYLLINAARKAAAERRAKKLRRQRRDERMRRRRGMR